MKLRLTHVACTLVIVNIFLIINCLSTSPQTDNKTSSEKKEKNILVFSFPGGKSHNFIFRELFKYSKERLAKENPNIHLNFYLIIHNFDKNIWEGSDWNVIGYGDVRKYEEQFFKAMENAKDDPVFGYSHFNKAMIHLYYDFLRDGLLDKLRGIKFDLLISDIVNFLSPFLKRELNIEKQMYMNPTCIYTWLNTVFEYNPSYHPSIGTPFTEKMNFFERFVNQAFLIGTRMLYLTFQYSQNNVFREFGFDYDLDPFPKDAIFLNQCVDGVHYPISLPPNVITTGAILPKPSKDITDPDLNNFLSKYERNIYVSQGTITKVLRLEVLREVFGKFKNVGFVLSIKPEAINEGFKFPDNVLLKTWVPQNDLLGDNRINAFITHGGVNSLLESLYHAKPLIVFGTSIDQVNGAVLVDYRKLGIGITKDKDISFPNLVHSIEDILNNPVYKENCKKASQLVRQTDGKETFYYWLNYTLEYGYQHLIVGALKDHNFIQRYNVDVALAWLLILYLFFRLIKFLYRKAFGNSKMA